MRFSRGLTFIELLLVISLVAILAGLSSSFYSRFLTQNSVHNTADQLIGALRKAQSYSQSGRSNSNWGVAYGDSRLTLYKGSAYTTRDPAVDETITVNPTVTVAGLGDINFTRISGLPMIGSLTTITISGYNTVRTITINTQGLISQ